MENEVIAYEQVNGAGGGGREGEEREKIKYALVISFRNRQMCIFFLIKKSEGSSYVKRKTLKSHWHK